MGNTGRHFAHCPPSKGLRRLAFLCVRYETHIVQRCNSRDKQQALLNAHPFKITVVDETILNQRPGISQDIQRKHQEGGNSFGCMSAVYVCARTLYIDIQTEIKRETFNRTCFDLTEPYSEFVFDNSFFS